MNMFDKKYLNLTREFIISWFKLRDQGTVLGLFWSFLNPLIMTTVLYFLFRSRMRLYPGDNYFLYMLVGTVAYNFFGNAVVTGFRIYSEMALMVRNVVFPKEILILSRVGVLVSQHIFELLAVLALVIFTGIGASPYLLFLPFAVLLNVLLVLGLSFHLTYLCVHARDLERIWNTAVRIGFFATPIFYHISSLSPQFRWMVAMNPMTQIVNFYRDAIFYHRAPDLAACAVMSVVAVGLCWSGYRFFKAIEPEMIERL